MQRKLALEDAMQLVGPNLRAVVEWSDSLLKVQLSGSC